MKRIIAITLLCTIATLGAAVRLSAQAGVLSATVPFGFTVGNRLLPTGTYRITPYGDHSQVQIESKERGITTYVLALQIDVAPAEQSKLVFEQIGDQYFLKKIVSKSMTTSLAFPTSKSEKKAQMQQARSIGIEAKPINP